MGTECGPGRAHWWALTLGAHLAPGACVLPESVRPHRAPQYASVLRLTAGLLDAMVSALQRATGTEVTAGDAHTAPQDATHHVTGASATSDGLGSGSGDGGGGGPWGGGGGSGGSDGGGGAVAAGSGGMAAVVVAVAVVVGAGPGQRRW
jgi:uncharacterized membrane protein YgcG